MTGSIENLPAHIVRSLLERSNEVAEKTAAMAAGFTVARNEMRDMLAHADVIHDVSTYVASVTDVPRLAAIDGGLILDQRAIGDMATAVGVSVGPGDDDGDSRVFMEILERSAANKDILTGIMSAFEVGLAASCSGGIVLIDGSITSTLINIAKGINRARSRNDKAAQLLLSLVDSTFRDNVMKLLNDRRYVAMPKYTTTNEFRDHLPAKFATYDARTIATMVLRPGEMTAFCRLASDGDRDMRRKLIGPALGFSGSALDDFLHHLNGISSCYFRPHPWTPSFRLDTLIDADQEGNLLPPILRAISDATLAPGLKEPLPLYLVDLYAKQISSGAAPVIEMATMAAVGDPDLLMLIATGYRT